MANHLYHRAPPYWTQSLEQFVGLSAIRSDGFHPLLDSSVERKLKSNAGLSVDKTVTISHPILGQGFFLRPIISTGSGGFVLYHDKDGMNVEVGAFRHYLDDMSTFLWIHDNYLEQGLGSKLVAAAIAIETLENKVVANQPGTFTRLGLRTHRKAFNLLIGHALNQPPSAGILVSPKAIQTQNRQIHQFTPVPFDDALYRSMLPPLDARMPTADQIAGCLIFFFYGAEVYEFIRPGLKTHYVKISPDIWIHGPDRFDAESDLLAHLDPTEVVKVAPPMIAHEDLSRVPDFDRQFVTKLVTRSLP